MPIIIVALSIAFCWVEIINPKASQVFYILKRKPFTCVKCLTGWVALFIGCYLFGWIGFIYLPLGLFAGAIFSSIQMRWL